MVRASGEAPRRARCNARPRAASAPPPPPATSLHPGGFPREFLGSGLSREPPRGLGTSSKQG
eukprot:8212382-Pyramimonas_sp.AAC.1